MRTLSLLLCLFSFHTAAADIEELITQAENHNPQAQLQLAQSYAQGIDVAPSMEDALYWYQQAAHQGNAQAQVSLANVYLSGQGIKKDLEKALYWLTIAATEGNSEAQYQLGQLYEQLEQHPDPLKLAELWYEKAAQTNPEAELAYSRLLEQQFNNRRAKQVAAIGQLEVAFDDSSIELSTQAKSRAASQKQQSEVIYGLVGTIVLCVIALFWLLRTIRTLKNSSSLSSNDAQRQNVKFERELQRKEATIKQQKKQLETLFRHVKKLQVTARNNGNAQANSTSTKPDPAKESPISLACALFGFKPDAIPAEKQIKVRYKQLSKIYHPDLKGTDEEMKRLNHALKIILKHVNK